MVVTSPGPTHSSPLHDSSNSHPTAIINQPLTFHDILTLHNKFEFSSAPFPFILFPLRWTNLFSWKKQTFFFFFSEGNKLVSATVTGKMSRQFCPARSSRIVSYFLMCNQKRIVYYVLEIYIHVSENNYMKNVWWLFM